MILLNKSETRVYSEHEMTACAFVAAQLEITEKNNLDKINSAIYRRASQNSIIDVDLTRVTPSM